MMVPVVALNAPLNVALATNVVRHRTRGAKDTDKGLTTAIRLHGNNAEFVPLALVLMLVCELCGAWLHIAGGALLAARVAHALGMPMKAPNPLRSAGVVGTWGVIIALGAYALWLRTKA